MDNGFNCYKYNNCLSIKPGNIHEKLFAGGSQRLGWVQVNARLPSTNGRHERQM